MSTRVVHWLIVGCICDWLNEHTGDALAHGSTYPGLMSTGAFAGEAPALQYRQIFRHHPVERGQGTDTHSRLRTESRVVDAQHTRCCMHVFAHFMYWCRCRCPCCARNIIFCCYICSYTASFTTPLLQVSLYINIPFIHYRFARLPLPNLTLSRVCYDIPISKQLFTQT